MSFCHIILQICLLLGRVNIVPGNSKLGEDGSVLVPR